MRWRRCLRSGEYEDTRLQSALCWPLTDGEINYLYWFIQGSIMNVGTRWALRHAWGLCERHAWAALAVEMAFRSDYVLGPTILYRDLLERCREALPHSGPLREQRLLRRLRPSGPCMMCAMRLYWATGRGVTPELLERGRRTEELRTFAVSHRQHWQTTHCPLCVAGSWTATCPGLGQLCRPHILKQGKVDVGILRDFLEATLKQVWTLDRSFTPEYRGTATPEVRAGLLTAVGWFSGWRPLLALIDQSDSGGEVRPV
jgi:hypothetical protein